MENYWLLGDLHSAVVVNSVEFDEMTHYDRVWKLLEDPERWCQGDNAVDAKGYPVPPSSDRATRWCLRGAVRKVYPNDWQSVVRLTPCIHWNDAPERTHAEVIALCKELDI